MRPDGPGRHGIGAEQRAIAEPRRPEPAIGDAARSQPDRRRSAGGRRAHARQLASDGPASHDRSGRERRPTPRRERQRPGPQPHDLGTAGDHGGPGRRQLDGRPAAGGQRSPDAARRTAGTACSRRWSSATEAASAANRWKASIRPASTGLGVRCTGDRNATWKTQLAGDEHREDLRPGAAAGAQPGQRTAEEDRDGEQHRRIGQLTAAHDVAEGGKLGGDDSANTPARNSRQRVLVGVPHGRHATAPTRHARA